MDLATSLQSDTYLSSNQVHHSLLRFVLKPRLSVLDDLSISARFDIDSHSQSKNFLKSGIEQQASAFLFYENEQSIYKKFPSLILSELFLEFKQEFFQVQLGKMPYHFGLGLTYFDDVNSLSNWNSYLTGVSLSVNYENLHLQPRLFIEENFSELTSLLQAGIDLGSWSVEAFYQYAFSDQSSQAEVFGKWSKDSWLAQASVAYVFQPEVAFALALDLEAELPLDIPSEFALKLGFASEKFAMHPNYDLGLLFWNYRTSSSKGPLFVEEGRLKDVTYASPSLVFGFFGESLVLKPLLLFSLQNQTKKINYELNLQATYYFREVLSLNVILGTGFEGKKDYGILTQVAMGF